MKGPIAVFVALVLGVLFLAAVFNAPAHEDFHQGKTLRDSVAFAPAEDTIPLEKRSKRAFKKIPSLPPKPAPRLSSIIGKRTNHAL